MACTGKVDSSSGDGLNWVEKVAPPRPKAGIVSKEMDSGRTTPIGSNDMVFKDFR
jgi:hypothetical protein